MNDQRPVCTQVHLGKPQGCRSSGNHSGGLDFGNEVQSQGMQPGQRVIASGEGLVVAHFHCRRHASDPEAIRRQAVEPLGEGEVSQLP
jgi:hypothetical protein